MIYTKKILATFAAIAFPFLMQSCSKDNQDVDGIEYEIQSVWRHPQNISKVDFEKEVSGHAWRWLSSNEIKENGKVDYSRGYYEDMCGGGPHNLYFGDNYYLRYFHDLSYPLGPVFRTVNSEYDDKTSTVYFVDNEGSRGSDEFVILKTDSQRLFVKEYMAITYDGNDGYRPVYAVSVYQKMTEEEYESYKKEFRDYNEAVKEHNEKYRQ